MRTKRIKLFSFPELSKASKKNAVKNWIHNTPKWREYADNEKEAFELLDSNIVCKETAVFSRSGRFFNNEDLS